MAGALATAALLGAWVLAALAPAAALADAAQVSVVSPEGEQQTLSLEALAGEEDVRGRTYALRAATGGGEQTVDGFSLAAILDAAGVDPYGFTHLYAQRPAGGSVMLSRHQALDDGAFPDGPPVVYATGGGTGFLRPSGGEDDLNAADSFEAPQGITLVLRTGTALRVRAEASTARTRPGQPVDFRAVVDLSGAGERLTYSWYFDDGHSASGWTARHSFARRGSYDVVVGVTTPGDDVGASAVVTVQVGAPIAGPERKGGGRSEKADAPDHGAAAGSGEGSAGGGGARTAPSPRPVAGATSPSRPSPRKQRPRRSSAPAGERVEGELIAAETEPAAPQPTRSAAARTGQLDEAEGAGIPDAALGLLVTAALLGAGALAELRSPFVSLGVTNDERGS